MIVHTNPKTFFSHEYDENDVFTIGDSYHTKVYTSKPVFAILKKDAAESALDGKIEGIDSVIGICKIYEQVPTNDIAKADNPKKKSSVMFEYEYGSVKMKYVEAWEYLDIVKESVYKGDKNRVRPFGSLSKNIKEETEEDMEKE